MDKRICYLYEREDEGEKRLFNSKDKAILYAISKYLRDIKDDYLNNPDMFRDDKISIDVLLDVCDLLEWGNCLGDSYITIDAIEVPEEDED